MKPQQILDLEKELGFELWETKTPNDIFDSDKSECYFLDDKQEVLGLNLTYCKLKDICFLQGLSNLETLNLSGNQITDYSFLQGLSNLKKLNLTNCKLKDISFLEGLSNLEYLNISDNDIQDFGYLKSLKHLNEFYANKGVVDWHLSFQTNGENTRIVLRFESKILCGCWANNRNLEWFATATLQDFRKYVEQKYEEKSDAYCPQLWTFLN